MRACVIRVNICKTLNNITLHVHQNWPTVRPARPGPGRGAAVPNSTAALSPKPDQATRPRPQGQTDNRLHLAWSTNQAKLTPTRAR